ncbi:hypothetical protein N566_27400, partial [Streptomycetaceae bacterium MP113-05]
MHDSGSAGRTGTDVGDTPPSREEVYVPPGRRTAEHPAGDGGPPLPGEAETGAGAAEPVAPPTP